MYVEVIFRLSVEYSPDKSCIVVTPHLLDRDGREQMEGTPINCPPYTVLDLGPFEARLSLPEASIALMMGLHLQPDSSWKPRPDEEGMGGVGGDTLLGMP